MFYIKKPKGSDFVDGKLFWKGGIYTFDYDFQRLLREEKTLFEWYIECPENNAEYIEYYPNYKGNMKTKWTREVRGTDPTLPDRKSWTDFIVANNKGTSKCL